MLDGDWPTTSRDPVLLISVWADNRAPTEDDDGAAHPAVRIRILSHPRIVGRGSPMYSSTIEETLDVVRRWLEVAVGGLDPSP